MKGPRTSFLNSEMKVGHEVAGHNRAAAFWGLCLPRESGQKGARRPSPQQPQRPERWQPCATTLTAVPHYPRQWCWSRVQARMTGCFCRVRPETSPRDPCTKVRVPTSPRGPDYLLPFWASGRIPDLPHLPGPRRIHSLTVPLPGESPFPTPAPQAAQQGAPVDGAT